MERTRGRAAVACLVERTWFALTLSPTAVDRPGGRFHTARGNEERSPFDFASWLIVVDFADAAKLTISGGRSPSRISLLGIRIVSLSTRFSSSRTLPGQE